MAFSTEDILSEFVSAANVYRGSRPDADTILQRNYIVYLAKRAEHKKWYRKTKAYFEWKKRYFSRQEVIERARAWTKKRNQSESHKVWMEQYRKSKKYRDTLDRRNIKRRANYVSVAKKIKNRTRLSNEKKEILYKEWLSGLTWSQICIKHEVSTASVSRAVKMFNKKEGHFYVGNRSRKN